MIRVAVISDVHANAGAFRAALACARAQGFDRLIILGDLLTYGCDPHEVLDLTADAVARDGAVLIKGNHDQMYLDLAAGACAYRDRLPDWLRETTDWTHAALEGRPLAFDWQESLQLDGVFFAHANPFAYGDWSYLNTEANFRRAASALQVRGMRAGIFGHTHRARILTVADKVLDHGQRARLEGGDTVIANPGSCGQPRDARRESSMMRMDIAPDALDIAILPVNYDLTAFRTRMDATALSDATKTRLLEFFP